MFKIKKYMLYQLQELDNIETTFPLAVRHFEKLLPLLTVFENVVQLRRFHELYIERLYE